MNRSPELENGFTGRPSAVVHMDLDGAKEIYRGHGWDYPYSDDPLFESGMRNSLQTFADNGVKATLFVIASSIDDARKRFWIDEAVRAGHEIASHTVTHRYLTTLASAEKRHEIAASRQILQNTLGVEVRGFRAPGYRIDRECMELVAECGYGYDASAIPNAKIAQLLGVPVSKLRGVHYPVEGSGLVELPMPDHSPLPFPFNPSYSLICGNWYFRLGLQRHRRRGSPMTLLFHLTDFSDPLPSERLKGVLSRVFTLSTLQAADKLRRCQEMLELVRRHYRITMTQAALDDWRNNADSVIRGGVWEAREIR